MKWLNNLISRFRFYFKPGLIDPYEQTILNVKLGNSFKGHSMRTACSKIKNGMTLSTHHVYFNDSISQRYNSVADITTTYLYFRSNWHYDKVPLWFQHKIKEIIGLHSNFQSAQYLSDQLEIYIDEITLSITIKTNAEGIDFLNHYDNIRLIKENKHILSIVRSNIKNSTLSDWDALNIDSLTGKITLNKGITQNIRHK